MSRDCKTMVTDGPEGGGQASQAKKGFFRPRPYSSDPRRSPALKDKDNRFKKPRFFYTTGDEP